jgi:hypothetical protein
MEAGRNLRGIKETAENRLSNHEKFRILKDSANKAFFVK